MNVNILKLSVEIQYNEIKVMTMKKRLLTFFHNYDLI